MKKNKLKINQNFSFSPLTTDTKKNISIFGNVNLHPIGCPYDDFVNYLTKNHLFLPHHLDSRNTTEREAAREIVQNFLKHVAILSNSNLIRNANSLVAKNEPKIDTEVEFSCVPDVHPKSQAKFNLGY